MAIPTREKFEEFDRIAKSIHAKVQRGEWTHAQGLREARRIGGKMARARAARQWAAAAALVAAFSGVAFLTFLSIGCDSGREPAPSLDWPDIPAERVEEVAPPDDQVQTWGEPVPYGIGTFDVGEFPAEQDADYSGTAVALADAGSVSALTFSEDADAYARNGICEIKLAGQRLQFPVDGDRHCVVEFDGRTYGWRP